MATFIRNGFNIATDAHLTLIYKDPITGASTSIPADALGHLMEINAEQSVETVVIEPITDGGRSVNENLYTGWTGAMGWTRANGALTALLSALEQNYYSGLRAHFDLGVTVNNIDGTQDQYLFVQCSLNRPQFGQFRMRAAVEQTLGFTARTMIVTSGPSALIPQAA
jgi:hypothetical protein